MAIDIQITDMNHVLNRGPGRTPTPTQTLAEHFATEDVAQTLRALHKEAQIWQANHGSNGTMMGNGYRII